MENRETIKEELTELLEKYYDGSFAELVYDYIRSTGMTQQEVERLLEEITKRKGPEAPFSLLSNSSTIQRLLILPCIGGMLC